MLLKYHNVADLKKGALSLSRVTNAKYEIQ